MSQPASDARFAAGVRLFNHGNFFEAHDVWEQVWKNVEGEDKTFYQGLIQAAAALLHVQRGNSVGAISVYLKSRPRAPRLAWPCKADVRRSEAQQK